MGASSRRAVCGVRVCVHCHAHRVRAGGPPPSLAPHLSRVRRLRRLRTFILNLDCDPTGAIDDIVVTDYNEQSPYCTFRVRATTRAACGVADVPPAAAAAAPASTPGANFGFTVLGGVLTVGGYAAFLFADSRGYLDSLRARLPSSWRGGGYSSKPLTTSSSYGAA